MSVAKIIIGLAFAAILALTATLGGQTPQWSDDELARNPALKNAVEWLKKKTPPSQLKAIVTMMDDDLISLLRFYGMWIRNDYLRAKSDPELTGFLTAHGVNDLEAMSMVMIRALWIDLNDGLSPSERTSIAKKRAVAARRRASYEILASQCRTQVERTTPKFEGCYSKYGLPSRNPENREPFFGLVVASTGRLQNIVFFEGASQPLKACLRPLIEDWTFSGFVDDPKVTLYITESPHCVVQEQSSLYR